MGGPKISRCQICGVLRAAKEVLDRVWGQVATGAKVGGSPPDSTPVAFESAAVPRPKLGQGTTVWARKHPLWVHPPRRGGVVGWE